MLIINSQFILADIGGDCFCSEFYLDFENKYDPQKYPHEFPLILCCSSFSTLLTHKHKLRFSPELWIIVMSCAMSSTRLVFYHLLSLRSEAGCKRCNQADRTPLLKHWWSYWPIIPNNDLLQSWNLWSMGIEWIRGELEAEMLWISYF